MKKYTYCDLEQAIYNAWQTMDDLKLFAEEYYDGPQEMTVDEAFNYMEGIRVIGELKFRKLMDMMCRVHELNEYCTDPEKLARRDEVFESVFNIPKKKKGSKK